MTLREILEAIDREAEKALIGHRLDLDCEVEVRSARQLRQQHKDAPFEGRTLRLERAGARVVLVIE